MLKTQMTLVCAVAAVNAAAFVDDFNGSELATHWNVAPEAGNWEYSISEGRLHVSAVYGTTVPFGNVTLQSDLLDPLTDFRLTARIGAGLGLAHGIRLELTGLTQPMGVVGYSSLGLFPTLVATAGGGNWMTAPSLLSGDHTFEIIRVGPQVVAFIDSIPMASYYGPAHAARRVSLTFLGRGETALQVDRVALVRYDAKRVDLP